MSKEIRLYAQVLLFSEIVFGLFYFYLLKTSATSPVNYAVANTAVFVMGLSMILSGVCYFWNTFDRFSIYKKYLGLVGFGFAAAHFIIHFQAFTRLFSPTIWQRTFGWVLLSGLVSLLIFTVMALISNNFMARKLGGRNWKLTLRTGYIALLLAGIHVVLLRSDDWASWYSEGMHTLPSLNMLIALFILIVIGMRIALWIALKRKKSDVPPIVPPTPARPLATNPVGSNQPQTPTKQDSPRTMFGK